VIDGRWLAASDRRVGDVSIAAAFVNLPVIGFIAGSAIAGSPDAATNNPPSAAALRTRLDRNACTAISPP
jgi:hypothetical protein